MIQLRPYQPADYQLFCSWYAGHDRTPPPDSCLPPIGVVVLRDNAPAVMLFLYIAQGVGVCFVEHLVAKPGLTTAKTREAAVHACNYLKNLARDLGYFIMIAHTIRGIARVMEREGWHKGDDTKLSEMFTATDLP